MHDIQSGTKRSHALKLMRPSTDPSMRIGVIAAKTSWKYTSVDCGMLNAGPDVMFGIEAWFNRCLWSSTGPGWPMKLAKNLESSPPLPLENPCHGLPKPMLKPQSTHAMSTSAKAVNDSIMLLTDQRFCMTPP